MNLHTLNPWAILVAAASAFALGGVWYTVLFGKAWMRANGLTSELPATSMGKVFGISMALSLVMSFNLAMFLNDSKTTMAWGATAGFLAGFGWVTMGLGIVALFERRPFMYVLVNGGYLTVALTVMGAILGAWR
jgi:Protein of unknown function (DUF1761)